MSHCPPVNEAVDSLAAALLAWERCHMGNSMPVCDHYIVEVHFVPLSATERNERKQRLRALLLRGALRVVQQHKNRNQEAEQIAMGKKL